MTTRARLTALFSLLIAIAQFAGVGVVSTSSAGPASTEYYCCCPGECHCTADCCHHAPSGDDDSEPDTVRVGAGTPILEATVRCGVWTGTLQRSPDAPKAIPATHQRLAPVVPEDSNRRPAESATTISSRAILRASAPRAPPVSVNVA